MPRIETLGVLPWLWVAWAQDDYGNRSHLRRGFTFNHAYNRTLTALIKEADRG